MRAGRARAGGRENTRRPVDRTAINSLLNLVRIRNVRYPSRPLIVGRTSNGHHDAFIFDSRPSTVSDGGFIIPDVAAQNRAFAGSAMSLVQRGLSMFLLTDRKASPDAGRRPVILYNACTTDHLKQPKTAYFSPNTGVAPS